MSKTGLLETANCAFTKLIMKHKNYAFILKWVTHHADHMPYSYLWYKSVYNTSTFFHFVYESTNRREKVNIGVCLKEGFSKKKKKK